MDDKIWVFFYGSYMNVDVLREVDLIPERFEAAKVNGFDIVIGPRANLIRSDQHCVYGTLVQATHAELSRLYDHSTTVLGQTYLPEAVIVETAVGTLRPALCYIAHSMEPKRADKDYVERILKAARDFDFPAWYIERLESFIDSREQSI